MRIAIMRKRFSRVMATLVPASHAWARDKDVDARHKAGHDSGNDLF
jgi:hypothetical protein